MHKCREFLNTDLVQTVIKSFADMTLGLRPIEGLNRQVVSDLLNHLQRRGKG